MRSVTFIGLGLNDEKGITLEGLEEARQADSVFAEFYTNVMPNLNLNRLEELLAKKVAVLTRAQLEDENGRLILKASERGNVAFLVPGDPMTATTHVSVRLALAKSGLKSRVIHGPSISSAVCGATGLQSYKFGKSVTLPAGRIIPQSVLDTISENNNRGLHTLLLLDVNVEAKRQMTIPEAVAEMVRVDPPLGGRLAVGVARLGAKDQLVKASKMRFLKNQDFGSAPHSIVVVGKLHFLEAEALRVFCGAQDRDLEGRI